MPLIKYKNISPDEALLLSFEKPILRVCGGSRMYGTARSDESGNIISDYDIRDVVIPPYQFLTIIRPDFKPRYGNIGEDHVIYSLNFFVQKLLASNISFLELLFAPKEMVLIQTPIGDEILKLRDKLISKQIYNSMRGFAYSEYRKAKAEKLTFEKQTPTESQAWDTFREVFGPKWGDKRKEITDEIKALAYSCHEEIIVPSFDGISKKRREEFEKFGYCSSSACHSLRLLREITELLKESHITFPRPDAAQLRDVKQGRSTLKEFCDLYEEAKLQAEQAYKESKLPEKPQSEPILQWLEEKVVNAIADDIAFAERRNNE